MSLTDKKMKTKADIPKVILEEFDKLFTDNVIILDNDKEQDRIADLVRNKGADVLKVVAIKSEDSLTGVGTGIKLRVPTFEIDKQDKATV